MKLTINGKQYRAIPETESSGVVKIFSTLFIFMFLFSRDARLNENEIRPQTKSKHAYIAFRIMIYG